MTFCLLCEQSYHFEHRRVDRATTSLCAKSLPAILGYAFWDVGARANWYPHTRHEGSKLATLGAGHYWRLGGAPPGSGPPPTLPAMAVRLGDRSTRPRSPFGRIYRALDFWTIRSVSKPRASPDRRDSYGESAARSLAQIDRCHPSRNHCDQLSVRYQRTCWVRSTRRSRFWIEETALCSR